MLPKRLDEASSLRNARLVQIVMLFLQRDNMTLHRRRLRIKPSFSDRTAEMMMWSSSCPIIRLYPLICCVEYSNATHLPWNESTLKHRSFHGNLAFFSEASIRHLLPSYGVMILYDFPSAVKRLAIRRTQSTYAEFYVFYQIHLPVDIQREQGRTW